MKIAVVGSGVSGLGATWLLNEHSDHEVHLYEADSRLGGHANTADFKPPHDPNAKPVPVDTAFIVLNPSTYPNFFRFLKLKMVSIHPTEMTFSFSRDQGRFEWSGKSLFSVFCQPSRLVDPNMWRLIYDVLRFNTCSRSFVVDNSSMRDISIGEYLKQYGYSPTFRDNYLIPLTAAIWGTPPDECVLGFPARTLVQFMYNHHMLQIWGKSEWLTIKGGSKVYVNQIASAVPRDHIHRSTPVSSIRTLRTGKVELEMSGGQVASFDHVILACHSDSALKMLRAGNISPDEERILARFRWSKNEVVLHSDLSLMPKNRRAWSCWNYFTSSEVGNKGIINANIGPVAVTFDMNLLQHIPHSTARPVLVTLNPPYEPRGDLIQGRWTYEHPVLDSEAVSAQSEMSTIQNKRGISFAGAYMRYGFHEDGFTTGLQAATRLGAKAPFEMEVHDKKASHLWLAYAFNLFEFTGARSVVGFFLSCFLTITRLPISMFIDFSHLD